MHRHSYFRHYDDYDFDFNYNVDSDLDNTEKPTLFTTVKVKENLDSMVKEVGKYSCENNATNDKFNQDITKIILPMISRIDDEEHRIDSEGTGMD